MDLRIAIRDRRHARLLQRARSGDTKAFGALFGELHGPVFAYLDRRLPAPDDTEDLVSTVFHRFLLNLAGYDPERGSVTAWLMTMARNALVDHLRRRRGTVDVLDLAETLAGPGSDPLTEMIEDEDARRLRDAVRRLPAATRELIALRYGEGLRCREIAAMTGLGEAAVKQRLSRTVRELRRQLAGEVTAGGEVDYATP